MTETTKGSPMTPETKLTAEQLAQGRSLYDAMFAHVNAPESDYKPFEKAWECWLFDHGYQLMTASERDSKGSLMTPETKDRLVKLLEQHRLSADIQRRNAEQFAVDTPTTTQRQSWVWHRERASMHQSFADDLSSIVAQMDETPAPDECAVCGHRMHEPNECRICNGCERPILAAPADAPATERDLYDDLWDALDKVRTIPAAVPAPPVALSEAKMIWLRDGIAGTVTQSKAYDRLRWLETQQYEDKSTWLIKVMSNKVNQLESRLREVEQERDALKDSLVRLEQTWRDEIKERGGSGCGCYGKSEMQRKCANELAALRARGETSGEK